MILLPQRLTLGFRTMVPLRGATLLVLISCLFLVDGAQRGNRAQNALKEKKIKRKPED